MTVHTSCSPDRMIVIEKAAWRVAKSTVVFLIDRSKPFRLEPPKFWVKYGDAHRQLFYAERTQYSSETIANKDSIKQTLKQLIQSWQKRCEATI